MSEQIEIDGSNLCIPEDAFEKFQAVSMYEETEYITLTNVVPTQIAEETVICEDGAMTSNDEVLVELNTVGEVDVNSKQCDGEPQIPPKDDLAANNDEVKTQLPSGDSATSDATIKHGKKRGRKKKTNNESSVEITEQISECANVIDSANGPSESIEDIQNFIHDTDPAFLPRRRGRRPKRYNVSSDELSSSTRDLSKESIMHTTEPPSNEHPGGIEKRVPRKRGRQAKSHESSIANMSSSNEDEITVLEYSDKYGLGDTCNSSKRMPRGRGRPRKITHVEKDQQEIVNTVDESKSSDILDSLPEAIFTTKPKRRGRPKKKTNSKPVSLIQNEQLIQNESNNENNISSLDASFECEDDDLSLSFLSKIHNKKSDSDEGVDNEDKIQLRDLLDNDDTNKLEYNNENLLSPTRKRGRPKKVHTESVSQASVNIAVQEDGDVDKVSNEDKDDGDDISLSQIKKTLYTNNDVTVTEDASDTKIIEQVSQPHSPLAQEEISSVQNDDQKQSPGKRNSKMPIMSDFEYNLDSIEGENTANEVSDPQKDDTSSLLVEDVSRRPTRKKVRQTLQYHEESDEDPFANVELSDDEPRRKRKGRRYNSDDEYFPGDVREPATPSSSDSESNNDLDSDKNSRKRKYSKKSDNQSPKKRGKKPNAENVEKIVEEVKPSEIKMNEDGANDIEDCLHSSVIKTNDEASKAWGSTNTAFESFLAKKIQGTNLKIKKVSSTENADAITPIQIPTIDPNKPKKNVEMCTQTTKIMTSDVNVQTGSIYDVPMRENIPLTAEQSQKSCEFLTSIVNTTVELGKLMTQKSEDFIKKKINTDHVTDTFKMDYCVRKSFLLFKLAKHNLTQMEEDLAKQYEAFLSEHDLLKHRQEPKKIVPTVKADNDSDCEIVEVPVEEVKKTSKSKSDPKFNPKTVFLNKELSIKIAKKPSDEKKVHVKGKHTVWISDSVMVKKVKPTQSFLAQDSRNKKPPDQTYVTAKMVSDFFEDYYRKKTLATCALFTSPDWVKVNGNYVCNYFVIKQGFPATVDNNATETLALSSVNSSTSTTDANQNVNIVKNGFKISETHCPERLITLCVEVLRKFLPISSNGIIDINPVNGPNPDEGLHKDPKSLFELCINGVNLTINYTKDKKCSHKNMYNVNTNKHVKNTVLSLKTFCHQKISKLFINSAISYELINESEYEVVKSKKQLSTNNLDTNNRHPILTKNDNEESLLPLYKMTIGNDTPNGYTIYPGREVKSLFSLCIECIQQCIKGPNEYQEPVCLRSNCEEQIFQPKTKIQRREVKSLFSLCIECIQQSIKGPNEYVEPVCLRSNCEEKIIEPKTKLQRREVKSLFLLCVECIQQVFKGPQEYVEPDSLRSNCEDQIMQPKTKLQRRNVESLFSLCVDSIPFIKDRSKKYVMNREEYEQEILSPYSKCIISVHTTDKDTKKQIKEPEIKTCGRDIKSLFSLSIESIQMTQRAKLKKNYFQPSHTEPLYTPKSLKQSCLKYVLSLLFNHVELITTTNQSDSTPTLVINNELTEAFTINSVNTLSEEAFHNLQNTLDDAYEDDYDGEESYLNNDFEPSYEETEEFITDDNNWASQVQMEELRSCVNTNNTADTQIVNNDVLCNPLAVTIKSEPVEDVSENINDSVVVKIEPINELDEMTMIPDSVVTKSEAVVSSHVPDNEVHRINRTYSVDTFEEFVRRNKIIQSLNDSNSNEVYSQSSLRVRRQFEPDYDGQNDAGDGLLVPHTYTNIYNAKDCLMESSSDESNADKNTGKKKPAKRKVKPKKPPTKTSNKDETPPVKEKSKLGANEVDELTRKMKDRIRQENQSSDSELDDLPLGKRRNKGTVKEINKKATLDKSTKDAIQCNDVDSTEQATALPIPTISKNEVNNSNISIKNVLPISADKTKNNRKKKSHTTIDYQGPMELLECEPTIHEESDDNICDTADQLDEPNDAVGEPNDDGVNKINIVDDGNVSKEHLTEKEPLKIIDRFGWSCYPIDTADTKLYQDTYILLDKLPESFVQTYFEYQEITEQNQVDKEIDRLTNVNSLNRISKDKAKSKPRSKVVAVESKQSQIDSSLLLESSAASEPAHEFAPSDDDDANIDDEEPPPVPQRHAENTLAKSSLMNDESEDERTGPNRQTGSTIKQEPVEEPPTRRRPGPKSKTKVDGPRIPDGELILTADKMMKEELTLLHAPVTLNSAEASEKAKSERRTEIITRVTSGPSSRVRVLRKVHQQVKSDEDSSSEEEKQWVSTKEKLLKKLKKAPDASLCDAKRAKMVTEFIEKRGEGSETRKVTRGKYRGSRKKFLEREKQLKVLSKELYGDAAYPRKRYVTANYKGRRNIRKVIDKKSLERSTVKAIMEEFERKRRLNERQSKLREHLGCEDNVNVLVINDEVCLEYDFEEDRAAVTVHAFFTKVMKAHQYEGVKFMWDACFESLDKIESGHPGGGCILAHCMGLGKTLQVLALLHTVLTHPQVGMKRVLVCCPLSTVLNWVDEIHKWIGPVTDQLKVFELSKLKKTYERAYQLEDWYNGGGIFIIGYELFRSLSTLDPSVDDIRPTIVKKIRTALLDPGPDIVVCDEGHLLKNDCSVLAVAMSRVATRRRIVLTGTPMQNNLREYYCMVNFIKPNLLGSYAEYSNRFSNPIMNGQHRDSSEEDIKLMKTRTHILHKVLEGCLQRQEASVLYPYLPKKHEYTVFIPLTKCQWDLYKHYLYTYCKRNKQGILKDFHILQKIWSHPQVLHNFHTKLSDYNRKAKEVKLEDDLAAEDLTADDIKPADTEVWWLQYLEGGNMLDSIDSSNKFVAVFRILNECVELGDKVLIFSTSLFCLDSLEYFLKKINKWSLGQEYYRLDGSVPPEVRHKWCREFNADNNLMTKLFLISTRAGSLGLNMTAANRVIILDTSWNPAHDMQSIFRVYRFGQKKDCFIYRLVAMGTMEQKIYERSVTKQAVACRVVDEQQIDRHYNSADLAELYRLDEAGGSVECGVAAGVRDVALLRVARDGPVHAVHEHDSLLRASEPALPEHERAAAWQQFQLERAAEQNRPQSTKKGKLSAKGAQNAKPQAVETEIKPESTPEDEVETNKNQKIDIVNCSIPIQSNKPVFFDNDSIKNYIAETIVHTLIKHNFPNMQEVYEVTEVVNAVRAIVCKVQANEDNKDVAAEIIVKSMFENKKLPVARLANVVGKNLNANIKTSLNNLMQLQRPPSPPPQKKSARLQERELRNRNQIKEEENADSENILEPKEKKQKLSSDEPSESATSDVVIELNEDNVQSDHDSSATVSADELSEPEKPGPLSKKKGRRGRKSKKTKKLLAPVVEQPTENDDSILLSDDDDVSVVPAAPEPVIIQKADKSQAQVSQKTPSQVVQKIPAPAIEKPAQEPSNAIRKKIVVETRIDPKKTAKIIETVPLHPSLLTNKHFITIVAHTYLEGNPMLDEDAAMLAAHYSTQKAKKEVEAGKSITSGPLYDIAVKALSMETLQKLHNVTPKAPSKIAEATSMLLKETLVSLEESSDATKAPTEPQRAAAPTPAPAPAPAPAPPPTPAPPPIQSVIRRIKRGREYTSVKEPSSTTATPTYSTIAPVQTHAAPTASSNVVPVELFKGPSMPNSSQYTQQSHEESILPDDNLSTINSTQPPLHNILPVKAVAPRILGQRNRNPIIVRTVFSKSTSRPQPTVMQAVPPKPALSGISAAGGQIVVDASQFNNTICLDSDDDDEPAAAIVPVSVPVPVSVSMPVPVSMSMSMPVPVALTRVNPAQHMPMTRIMTTTNSYASPPLYYITSTSGSSTNNLLHSVPTLINTHTNPAIVSIGAPVNTFSMPATVSTVVSSPSPQKTTQPDLTPKTNPTDESTGRANHFILKINNKTLRVVQTAPPPDSVKTIFKLGSNDKLIPEAIVTEPVIASNVKKDQGSAPPNSLKSLLPTKPVTTTTNPPTASENMKNNQSAVSTQKSIKTPTNRRVLSVQSSTEADNQDTANSNKSDDPLDILKDIVHIQAYDTDDPFEEVKSNKRKSHHDVKPSPIKTTNYVHGKSQHKTKSYVEVKSLPEKAKSSVDVKDKYGYKKIAPKPSGGNVLSSINNETANSLTSILAKKKATVQGSTPKLSTKDLKVKEIINIKLDNIKRKSSTKASNSFIDLTSYNLPGPSNSKATASKSKQQTKPKVVNLTKNIVAIEKPVPKFAKDTMATVDITGEPSKSKMMTGTKSSDKKRSSTTVDIKPPKKKKLEELTLQDFDIDDLDDIIELE